MPYESFADPAYGLTREARRERDREAILALLRGEPREPPPSRLGDWPKISHAVRRDGVFTIEASTPDFSVMLHFCPERPDAGGYEIRHRPHGGVDRGRTFRVRAVPHDEKDEPASLLTAFAVRYVVFTTANDRAGRQMAWLVGLNSFRDADDPVDTDSPAG